MAKAATKFWKIDRDIRKASTLPGSFYTNPQTFAQAIEKIFTRSWQWVGDVDAVKERGQCAPGILLPGTLDEPFVLARDSRGKLRALSNVCTHRGALVCNDAASLKNLRCPYHGRRFGLDGKFLSMPEFEGVENFPSAKDSLQPIPLERWEKFLFLSPNPSLPFKNFIQSLESRLGWLPLEKAKLDPSRSRDYPVQANWALYCDNYLEGFHIPYVHAGLMKALDYGDYTTEFFPYSSLQIGIAEKGQPCLKPPKSSQDYGKNIAAYYFWLFPNTMFNFYPWGVSVNVVKPLAPDRSLVSFYSYVWDRKKLDRGAGSGLDRVEMEDEAVVQSVQRGVRSRFYDRGRYSPTQEKAVHHFHRLLTEYLDKNV